MNRSTCASGSGYVPSYSTGFWVANTRNGRASSCEVASTVTWRSCMHSSRPDWVFGDQHDVGEDRAGAELEARLALVVDLRAHDVGRQQVGRALHARELAVDRTRERPGQRRLADARIVLDQDVPLGQRRHDDALEHLGPDLDG